MTSAMVGPSGSGSSLPVKALFKKPTVTISSLVAEAMSGVGAVAVTLSSAKLRLTWIAPAWAEPAEFITSNDA